MREEQKAAYAGVFVGIVFSACVVAIIYHSGLNQCAEHNNVYKCAYFAQPYSK